MHDFSFAAIEEALSSETGKFFWAGIADGKSDCGDHESYLGKMIPDEHITFDVSNNKVLAHMDIKGSVKSFTSYRRSYPSDNWLPGIWWCKDFSQSGPYSFSLRIGSENFELDKVDWPVKTELLDNCVPLTTLSGDACEIKLLLFAPVSCDGSERPSAVIYGIWLHNISPSVLKGEVGLPKGTDSSNVSLADGMPLSNPFSIEVEPGGSVWIPAIIAAYPGEPVFRELAARSSLSWLNETMSFHRRMCGVLRMPDDPYTAEFLKRMINLCFCGITMTRDGEIAGANWGSYPVTTQIWMKDMGYTYMPFHALEPDLFRKGILWYLDKSIRFIGDKEFEGWKLSGYISYSLSIALTPVLMAGLYYRSTGDKEFFAEHPEVAAKIKDLLAATLESRSGDLYLFPSDWISDGPSRGDYHTGSNTVVWFAFILAAEVAEDALGDEATARKYREIAHKIKTDLDRTCIVDGPRGPQYTEGVNADGSVVFSHDGEESDTTLMPFFEYANYDDPAYQNHKRVAMTDANIYYKPHAKGIEDSTWIDPKDNPGIDATFPGYMTGFAGIETADEMIGPEGRMTIIRQLTDVDGSIWWWPYKHDKVVRAFEIEGTHVGKSGWSSSVFILHFISQILGLSYDAPLKILSFRPFSPSSDFEWQYFRMGNAFFSAGYERSECRRRCYVENHNDIDIRLYLELILEPGGEVDSITVDGEPYAGEPCMGSFFRSNTVKLDIGIPAKTRVDVEAAYSLP